MKTNYFVIRNIPKDYTCALLRNHFSDVIERDFFQVFHYVRRRELPLPSPTGQSPTSLTNAALPSLQFPNPPSAQNSAQQLSKPGSGQSVPETFCCVVALKDSETASELYEHYHLKPWTSQDGQLRQSRCFIAPVRPPCSGSSGDQELLPSAVKGARIEGGASEQLEEKRVFRTRGERLAALYNMEESQSSCPNQEQDSSTSTFTPTPTSAQQQALTSITNFRELHPPAFLPQGNVGTPRSVLLQQISHCALPSFLIKELGVSTRKPGLSRRYAQVPFNYAKEQEHKRDGVGTARVALSSQPSHDVWSADEATTSDEEMEEWDRQEALDGDAADEREPLFEDEVELQWEKGGSGLVLWTGVSDDGAHRISLGSNFEVSALRKYGPSVCPK